MEKRFGIGRHWEFALCWRKDWKFVGFIQYCGFGKYIGITFQRKKWD